MSHTAFGEGKREKKMQRDVCVCVCEREREKERGLERGKERGGIFAHMLSRFSCGYPWDSPGKNTGVGCHVPLQGIFLI